MDNVERLINSLDINKTEYVVVACSGGPDSMFLLYLLHSMGISCVAAHINHNVREESKEEYAFLEEYCKKNNILFEGTQILKYSKDNFHQFARNFRYQFFEKVITKYKAKYLFTAHHGDDLMETILMRIVRGSSVKGYAGFDEITGKNSYKIVRPLVYLTKENIREMCESENIPYVTDSSNESDHYTRNRYRHHVIPFLKEENCIVHKKFIEFHDSIKEMTNYIDAVVESDFHSCYKDSILDLKKFNILDLFIQKQILYKVLGLWYKEDLSAVHHQHIEEIFKLKSSNKNGQLQLPKGLKVNKNYQKLEFFKESEDIQDIDFILEDILKLPIGKIRRVNKSDEKSNNIIRLNTDEILLPIRIRNRKAGDRMYVKNMQGSKKIADIFIDEKVSKRDRERVPVVTDSNGNILWIPGVKKSKFDVPINGLYDIILKYEKGEE